MTSQNAVPSRSWSGSTAHRATSPYMVAASASHQPAPSGPNAMPVASVASAATSRPSGTTPAQAVITNSPASQPQARKRPR